LRVKVLPPRHGSIGVNLVAVVDEDAGAEMEAALKGEKIVVSFDGAEAQLAVIGDAVLMEAAVVAEHVESDAQVRAGR
jgi:hypothetical protein